MKTWIIVLIIVSIILITIGIVVWKFWYFFKPVEQEHLIDKIDIDTIDLSKRPRTVISFTTIPTRVKYIHKTIDRLKKQTLQPDLIYVCIPYYSKRLKQNYDIPKNLKSYNNVKIVRCEDFGPATKLLGCIELENDHETNIITIDDDQIYDKDVFKTLVAYSIEYPNATITNSALGSGLEHVIALCTKIDKSISSPTSYYAEGFGGVLYKRKFITNEMYDYFKNNLSKDCFLSDDLTISTWLEIQGVQRIMTCETKIFPDIDYEISDNNALYKEDRTGTYDSCHSELKLLLDNKIYSKYDIDLVYMWVDSSDINWQRLKNKYSEQITHKEINTDARWRDNNELKYSLRSLEKYAPFFRNIYLVTCCKQIPKWLDTNSNIILVDHTQIIPQTALPTFKSNSIEPCLYRIPGLSEYYFIMNDDTFFGNYCLKSDFITSDGKIKIFLESWPAFTQDMIVKIIQHPWLNYIKYTNELLDTIQYASYRYQAKHTPRGHRVSFDKKAYNRFKKEYDESIHYKFKNNKNITGILFDPYWALYNNIGIEASIDSIYMGLTDDNNKNITTLEKIKNNKPKIFCINDEVENNKEAFITMNKYLEEMFPDKSRWEL